MRPAECLHSLGKTCRRSAFSNTAKEQSSDDSQKKRERDRLWNHRFQREERCDLSRLSQVAEALCGQAHHRNRLGACSRVDRCRNSPALSRQVFLKPRFHPKGHEIEFDRFALTRWPGQRAFGKKMYVQMRNTFTRIWPAIDDNTIAVR